MQSRNISRSHGEQSALAGQNGRGNLARLRLDGDEIRLEQELDFGLQQQVVVDALEDFRANRQAAVGSGAAAGLQPLADVGPDAAGEHVNAVGEGHEDGQHAGGAHAAQARVAFGEEHAGSLPGGGDGRCHTRRSAAGDEDVDRVAHGNAALESQLVLGDLIAGRFCGTGAQPAPSRGGERTFQETSAAARHG